MRKAEQRGERGREICKGVWWERDENRGREGSQGPSCAVRGRGRTRRARRRERAAQRGLRAPVRHRGYRATVPALRRPSWPARAGALAKQPGPSPDGTHPELTGFPGKEPESGLVPRGAWAAGRAARGSRDAEGRRARKLFRRRGGARRKFGGRLESWEGPWEGPLSGRQLWPAAFRPLLPTTVRMEAGLRSSASRAGRRTHTPQRPASRDPGRLPVCLLSGCGASRGSAVDSEGHINVISAKHESHLNLPLERTCGVGEARALSGHR